MRHRVFYGFALVSVVCSSVSCRGVSSNAQQSVAPAASVEKKEGDSLTPADCVANQEQLPLKIYYAPRENALDTARVEYRADWDDHAEQVWRLEHFKVVDDVFITGTLTEGSAHLQAFDDEKQRFYRKSQWLCE